MLLVPDIQYNDICIPHDAPPQMTADCLWSIYCVIKKIIAAHNPDDSSCRRIIEYLYAIGVNGEFTDEHCSTLLVRGITNPKWKRAFPAFSYLIALEQYGFQIHHVVTESGECAPKKIKIKDVLQFQISYIATDMPNVILGLKLFADACLPIKGDPFYSADIRICFDNAAKHYTPPIEEIFSVLPQEQRDAALVLHKKLTALGCTYNLERDYMLRYTHPKSRGKTIATIYLQNQFWFPESDNGQALSFKLNLRHIGAYTAYLEQCTESVQASVVQTAPCYGCEKQCGGIRFTYQGTDYVKCPSHSFRFTDISQQSLAAYLHLLELEHQSLIK